MTAPADERTGRASARLEGSYRLGPAVGVAQGLDWVRVGAVAALTALLVFLALTPLPPFAREPFTALRNRHVVLGALMLAYLAWLAARRRLPGRTPYDLGVLALTGAIGLAVVRSATPRLGLEAVLPLLPTAVLLYALNDCRRLDGGALARATVLAATIVGAVALVQVGREYAEWLTLVRAVEGGVTWATLLPPSVPRVAGAGSHPNVLATVLAMALPAALLLWTDDRGRRWRVLLAGGVVIIVVALFFTLARAAWLAAGAGLSFTGAALLLSGGGRVLRPTRRLLVGLGGGVALVALIAGGLAASGARPQWLFRDSLGPRADMRRAGLAMWHDNPLTGAGPGQFAELYPLYDGSYPFAAVHAHNSAVQTAADLGLMGMAATALLLATISVTGWRTLSRGSATERHLGAAALGMLVVLLVHGLADAPHLFPEAQALAVVALVMLARAASGLNRAGTSGPRTAAPVRVARHLVGIGAPIAAVLVALALPLVWIWTDLAHAEHAASLKAARAGRWPEAVAAAERAVRRDEQMPAYWFQLGASHAGAAVDGDRQAEQRAALAAFGRGLELDAHNGAATTNWAALNVALGRPEGAREAVGPLGRLAGRDSLLLLAHATLVQWTLPPEAAIEQYAGLVVINPTLAATPFWRDGGFREANFDRIVERAKMRAGELAGTPADVAALEAAIDLYAGRATPSAAEARASVAARPGDVGVRVAAARVLMASPETFAEAGPLLRGAVARRGDDRAARAALGDWYAAGGDPRRARRQWLTAAVLGDPGAAVALGDSYAPEAVPRPVARRAARLVEGAEIERFYLIFQTFRFAHQRAEPSPIILPGDWLLALPGEVGRWRASVYGWQE